jgi:hypothetical protein
MKYILYPGYQLTVSAPAMVEITALADIQVVGVVTPTPTATTPVTASEEEIHAASPTTPIVVTVTPLKA